MGATESVPNKVQVKETVKTAASEDKMLYDKILERSKEIYKQNKENFLDEKFCKNLSISYSKKLYELPIQQIRDTYNKIENQDTQLQISTKYDPLEEEKFLINELAGRIVERFKNQKLKPVEYKGIHLSYPDIAYIQNRTLEILGEINKIEQNKLFGGRRRKPRYFNENEEEENEDENENENNNENENENNNENENEEEEDEEEEEEEEVNRRNKGKKKFNREFENKNKKQFVKNNKYTVPEIINIKKELDNILKSSYKQPKEETIKQNIKPNILPNVDRVVSMNVKINKKENNYPSNKNIKEMTDKHCLEEGTCKLTKKEMCEKIIYHFIVRNNIVAAILSTIPFPTKDGEYKGSFTFERLTSLMKGTFCLPPYEDIKYKKSTNESENDRMQKILKFINIMDEKQCLNEGGRLLILSKKQLEQLYKSDELGRKYFDFAMKINNFYQNALIALNDILLLLQNEPKLSTKNLNEISEKTKSIIDELYLKTQFNYLLAILVILEFKFDQDSSEMEITNNRLKKIIAADFSK